MRNHIRYFRKLRGLTLGEIGQKIGTTPQTVSRLETGAMTLSTDWLVRLGSVLKVDPIDLMDSPDRQPIPVIGVIEERGFLDRSNPKDLFLDLPSVDPVAVEIGATLGPFQIGDMLICDRVSDKDLAYAINQDCLATMRGGASVLCRLIASKESQSRYSLIPLQTRQDVIHNQELLWAAVLIMRITHL